VGFLDFTIFNHEDVSLATVTPEDGAAIEREVKGVGEGEGRVSEEADLWYCQHSLLLWES
jgi:hypothetical protein